MILSRPSQFSKACSWFPLGQRCQDSVYFLCHMQSYSLFNYFSHLKNKFANSSIFRQCVECCVEKLINLHFIHSRIWESPRWGPVVDSGHAGEMMSLGWSESAPVFPRMSWSKWLGRGGLGISAETVVHMAQTWLSNRRWMDGWILHITFREGLAYFSKTRLNHIMPLLQQRGIIVEKSRCWTAKHAIQTFFQLKTFCS